MGLSFILKANPGPERELKAKEMIFYLQVSPMDEQPKIYLSAGITNHLAGIYPDFLRDCWYGVLEYIARDEQLSDVMIRKSQIGYDVKQDEEAEDPEWLDKLVQSVVRSLYNINNYNINNLNPTHD